MKWLRMGISFQGRNYTSANNYTIGAQSMTWNLMHGDYILLKQYNITTATDETMAYMDWFARYEDLNNQRIDSSLIWKIECVQPNGNIDAQPYLRISMWQPGWVLQNNETYKRHTLRGVIHDSINNRIHHYEWQKSLPKPGTISYWEPTILSRLFNNLNNDVPVGGLPAQFWENGLRDPNGNKIGLVKCPPMQIINGVLNTYYDSEAKVSLSMYPNFNCYALNPSRWHNLWLGMWDDECIETVKFVESYLQLCGTYPPFSSTGNHKPVWQDHAVWEGDISNSYRSQTITNLMQSNEILSIVSCGTSKFFTPGANNPSGTPHKDPLGDMNVHLSGWWAPVNGDYYGSGEFSFLPSFVKLNTLDFMQVDLTPYNGFRGPLPYISAEWGDSDEYSYSSGVAWQISDNGFRYDEFVSRGTAMVNMPHWQAGRIPWLTFTNNMNLMYTLYDWKTYNNHVLASQFYSSLWSGADYIGAALFGNPSSRNRSDVFGSFGIRVMAMEGNGSSTQNRSWDGEYTLDCYIVPSTYSSYPALDIYSVSLGGVGSKIFQYDIKNTNYDPNVGWVSGDESQRCVNIYKTCFCPSPL